MGQTTTADPSRSPKGTESVWAYTHLPRNAANAALADARVTGWPRRKLGRAVIKRLTK